MHHDLRPRSICQSHKYEPWVPLAFHKILCFQAFANLNFSSLVLVLQKTPWQVAATGVGLATRLKGAALALSEVVIVSFFTAPSRFLSVSDDPLRVSRLIQWNPAHAPAMTPAMVGDSLGPSGRSYSSSSRYSDRDARRFKAERDETRLELGDISKKARIAELEWEHQRKQLLEAIDGESCDLFNLNSALN
jgi:hypothetical protein